MEASAQVEDGDRVENSSSADETGPTFPLDVSGPGGERLRSTVKTKLSEFMGSYTDDVLAEYIVVLVGHGKQQKQATADLEAFLGHQSETFVSWLWDHLTSNLHDYSQPLATELPESSTKIQEDPLAAPEVVTEAEAMPEAVADDPSTSQKKQDEDSTKELDKKTELPKKPRSPEPWSRKRKFRSETKETPKPPPVPEKAPPPRLKASRRLLEFAIRDAVDAVTKTTAKKSVDSAKRLRSVVSTFQENVESHVIPHVNGESDRPKHGSKVSPAMIIALKAAAAAAEDVSRPPDMEFTNRKKDKLPLDRKAAADNTRPRVSDTEARKKDTQRRTVQQKFRHPPADKPVQAEDESQDVKEMRKRMRQVELEVSRLRTNQKTPTTSPAVTTTPVQTVAAPKVEASQVQAVSPTVAPSPAKADATENNTTSTVRPAIVRPPAMRMPVRGFARGGGFMRGAPYMIRPPPRLARPPYPTAPHLQWKRDGATGNGGGQSGGMKNGFRSPVGGPIRHKRSLSYVRPNIPATHPSSDATAATTGEEQKGS